MVAPKGIVAAILVLALTGCGGSGDDVADPTAPPNEATATVQSTLVPTTTSSSSPVETSSPPTTTTTTTTTTAPTTTGATTTTAPRKIGDLAPGLFCRDLDAAGFAYSDAVAYWVREGEPERMDADRNHMPCETVYPEGDVLAF